MQNYTHTHTQNGIIKIQNLESVEMVVWKMERALFPTVKGKGRDEPIRPELKRLSEEKGQEWKKKSIFEESLLHEQRVTLGDVLEIWAGVIFLVFHKTRLTKESLIKGLFIGGGRVGSPTRDSTAPVASQLRGALPTPGLRHPASLCLDFGSLETVRW